MADKSRVDVAQLRSLPLLSDARDEHLQRLALAASLRTAPPRAILFGERSRVEAAFILTRGAAELFSEDDDRRFTVAVVRGPRPLQVSSILAERHPLSARTLERSEFIRIPAKLIVDLIRCDSGLAEAVVREIAGEALQVIEDFKKHRLLNTTARIAHWMLQWDSQNGANGHIVIPFDKRVLASYLGMTPEQLSRGFATLGSAGVTVDGRVVNIRDRATLTRIARREQ